MNPQKIAPELRPIFRYLPPLPFHKPRPRPLIRFLIRAFGRTGLTPGVSADNHRVGDLKLRVYQPQEPCGAGLIWAHGGGFVIGSVHQDDRFCSRLASDLGLVVVSVVYRLAPEHPFPAALDDCAAAWDWLQERGPELGVDPSRIALSGQSAGAGLAACLAQRLFDRGGVQPAAQALIYPMLDDRTAADRSLDSEQHPLWNNLNNHGGWASYLGQEPGLPEIPEYAAASRRKDLSGLPPAWIGVGEIDLFYREDKDYAERLARAGVPCTLEVFPGAPHGFNVAAPRAAVTREFQRSFYQFLVLYLSVDSIYGKSVISKL